MIIREKVRYTGDHPLQVMNVFIPEGEVRAAFLYIHGGGLDHDDMSNSTIWADYLTEHGIAFFSTNYRLYPDAKYPDYILDAAAAVAYALKLTEEIGTDKFYVGGSSAGGYLSMMLCFDTHYLKDAGVDPDRIAGYLHDAGQPTAHFTVLKHRGIDPRRVIIDDTSPLYFIGLEEKYPPMRFIVSDNDIESRYEQTMLTLSTLKHFGHTDYDHVVMHGTHVQYNKDIGEDGIPVMSKMILDFISKVENGDWS